VRAARDARCTAFSAEAADIVREPQRCGLVATISNKTVWRWLHEAAIRPWQARTWLFPRDPEFAVKAGRILDLYARRHDGSAPAPDEFVISADEKTSILAHFRCHASTPPQPRQPGAWSMSTREPPPEPISPRRMSTAQLFGHCERTTSIEPFQRLVTLADVEERLFGVSNAITMGSPHRSNGDS
jgi:hypothetical protein